MDFRSLVASISATRNSLGAASSPAGQPASEAMDDDLLLSFASPPPSKQPKLREHESPRVSDDKLVCNDCC